jgi:hypothetical protein
MTFAPAELPRFRITYDPGPSVTGGKPATLTGSYTLNATGVLALSNPVVMAAIVNAIKVFGAISSNSFAYAALSLPPGRSQ